MDDLLDDNCEPICEDLDRDCSDEVCALRNSRVELPLDGVIRLSRCQFTCLTDECTADVVVTEVPDQPTDGPDQPTDGPDQPTDGPDQPTDGPDVDPIGKMCS